MSESSSFARYFKLTLCLFAAAIFGSMGNRSLASDDAPVRKKDSASARNVGGIIVPVVPGGNANAKAGTITGIINYKGPVPRKPIKSMAGNAFCNAQWAGKFPVSQMVVASKNGLTLGNVLVYVSNGLAGRKFAVPKTPVILDQKKCLYKPHAVALMARQPIHILNSDQTLHNVFTFPKNNAGFNIASVFGQKLVKQFKPEIGLRVQCSVHPWMYANIHVLDHPFFAITNPDGKFTLTGLPPGNYEVTVWHEYYKIKPATPTIKVTIKAGQSQKIQYLYDVVKKPVPKPKKKVGK
jgi:hypothetical protein